MIPYLYEELFEDEPGVALTPKEQRAKFILDKLGPQWQGLPGYDTIQHFVQKVAAVDPTPKGIYMPWIARLAISKPEHNRAELKPYYATWSDPSEKEYSQRKKEAVLDPKQYVQVKLGAKLTDKDATIKSLLEKFKANQYNDVLMLMNSLQGMGIDYPEFAAIRKSIAVEMNKKNASS